MSVTHVQAIHDASCPEIAPLECSLEDIPDHTHDQSLTLLRLEPRFTAGLGRGFALGLSVPIDLKVARIRYQLTDGSSYVPSYAGLHHRDEDLFGLGDSRLELSGYRMIPTAPITLGARLGVVLPTGKIEDNPFEAQARGEVHQHLQFGGGTVDPTVGLELILRGVVVGMAGRFDGRFPLYQNPKGYRGPVRLNATLGPIFRLPKPVRQVQLVVLARASWMSAEFWDGEPGENSGLGTVGAGIGATWNITPNLAVSGMLNFRFFEHARGAQFNQPVAGTLGISGFFQHQKKQSVN